MKENYCPLHHENLVSHGTALPSRRRALPLSLSLLSVSGMADDCPRLEAERSEAVEEAEEVEGYHQCVRASIQAHRLPPPGKPDERCSNLCLLRGLCSTCLESRHFASETEDEVG